MTEPDSNINTESEPEPEPQPESEPEPEPQPESEPEPEPELYIDLENFNTGITTFNDVSNLINLFINNTEIYNNITVKNSAILNIISDKTFNDISDQPTRIMNSEQTVDFVTANTKVNTHFQSFFQLLTEKPGIFVDISRVISTSTIDISWSLEHLYPNNINNLSLNIPNIPYKTLPIINTIYIDISYTFENGNNVYTNLYTITQDDVYENTTLKTKYITSPVQQITKTHVLNQLNQHTSGNYLLEDNSFSIFVWGDNNSLGNVNKLEYENIVFEKAKTPLIKSLNQYNIVNRNSIEFVLDLDIEELNQETTFNITHIDISYRLIQDKSYLIFSDNNIKTFQQSAFIKSNNKYIFTLTNLYFGSKYNVEFRAKNNGNNNYSNFRALNSLEFTHLPYLNIGRNIISSIHRSHTSKNLRNKYYTGNSYDSNRIYYHRDRNLYLSSINQQFSLSKTNSNINENQGYGIYIENSNNLLDISLVYYNDENNINYDKFYNIKFHGWKNNDISYINHFSNIPTSNVNTSDYFNNNINSGFFKKANITFNTINYQDLSANNKLQKILYKANSFFNSNDNIIIGDVDNQYFVVDTLKEIPNYSIIDFSINNITYIYNCGIPSVKDFNIILSIQINNLNSNLGWLIYNIGNIRCYSSINQINNNFIINNNDINFNGIYNFIYNNTSYFTQSNSNFDTSGHTFYIDGIINNLYGSKNINNQFTYNNLYCDYLSFHDNINNGKIVSSNCPEFYQLINNNIDTRKFVKEENKFIYFNDLSINIYNDHLITPTYPSLVYKNGKFTNNNDSNRNIFISKLSADINRTNTEYMNHLKNIKNNLIDSNIISNIQTQLIYFYKEINGNIELFIGDLETTFNGNSLWYDGNAKITNNGVTFFTDNPLIKIRGARESNNKIKIKTSWAYLGQQFNIDVKAEDVYFLLKFI